MQTSFLAFQLSGNDAAKFLQGQITANVNHLPAQYQATAISNLKGRVEYGIWLKKEADNQFTVVSTADCADALISHIKKFGAFSKIDLSQPTPIYPCVLDSTPSFSDDNSMNTPAQNSQWQQLSIATGNYWITPLSQGVFQPQELRLHQRGGVDYHKGCYLGQEVIARIYFKSAPKAYLHRVAGEGVVGDNSQVPAVASTLGEKGKIQVVNAVATDTGFEALVVARPEMLADSGLQVLPLPDALQADVARQPGQ